MSKQSSPEHEITALATRMLSVLEEQRRVGGDAYPPTLRRLGELCEIDGSDPRLLEAAGKKTFTEKAVVPRRKEDRKPELAIRLKDDPAAVAPRKPRAPKPKSEGQEIAALAERMLAVLESQRLLGEGSYPPTLRRMAELSDVRESDTRVFKAVDKGVFTDRAVVAWNEKGKPCRDALVFLVSRDGTDKAVEQVAAAVLIALLRRAMGTATHALTVAKLKQMLTERIKKPFQAAIERGIERHSLPPEVAWVKIGGPTLFLTDALQSASGSPVVEADGLASPILRSEREPTRAEPRRELPVSTQAGGPSRGTSEPAPAEAQDFAAAFRAAFNRLDREHRSTNFVRLLDLRQALRHFDREQFDAGLRQLRLVDEFTLDSHEGRHGPLTDEEREAGVREAGSLLVYVSRRS